MANGIILKCVQFILMSRLLVLPCVRRVSMQKCLKKYVYCLICWYMLQIIVLYTAYENAYSYISALYRILYCNVQQIIVVCTQTMKSNQHAKITNRSVIIAELINFSLQMLFQKSATYQEIKIPCCAMAIEEVLFFANSEKSQDIQLGYTIFLNLQSLFLE